MHEIKSPFLILMEEQSYLAQSLESAFEKQNVKVKIVTIAEASSIVISEKPSGYLICTSPELLKKAVSVKVMVDQAIKNKIAIHTKNRLAKKIRRRLNRGLSMMALTKVN